jgi:hypothetical protein
MQPHHILSHASKKDNLELKKAMVQETLLEIERERLNKIYK